jgi:ribosomal protein L3 glutamine methyltransferase
VERRFRAARLRFGHGTHGARDEAAWLLTSVLGLPHEELARSLARELTTRERRSVARLIEERIRTRRPLAYLLKEAWLGEHRFYVDRRVIVPRSFIAELLRARLSPWLRRPREVRRVLDLCTGSGCLAVLAARAFARARVTASDISADALAVARRNVARHPRIRLVRSDLFDKLHGTFDLILANPPYVTSRAMRDLPAEYRREPGLALAAGSDGLDVVRRILERAPAYLRPGGRLLCEVGDGRAAVERAYPRAGLVWPRDEVFQVTA